MKLKHLVIVMCVFYLFLVFLFKIMYDKGKQEIIESQKILVEGFENKIIALEDSNNNLAEKIYINDEDEKKVVKYSYDLKNPYSTYVDQYYNYSITYPTEWRKIVEIDRYGTERLDIGMQPMHLGKSEIIFKFDKMEQDSEENNQLRFSGRTNDYIEKGSKDFIHEEWNNIDDEIIDIFINSNDKGVRMYFSLNKSEYHQGYLSMSKSAYEKYEKQILETIKSIRVFDY